MKMRKAKNHNHKSVHVKTKSASVIWFSHTPIEDHWTLAYFLNYRSFKRVDKTHWDWWLRIQHSSQTHLQKTSMNCKTSIWIHIDHPYHTSHFNKHFAKSFSLNWFTCTGSSASMNQDQCPPLYGGVTGGSSWSLRYLVAVSSHLA